jgi:small subunit ribosomal protein S20
MANHVSALKRVRMTERRTEFNRARRSRLRTGLRTLRRLLDAKDAKGAAAAMPATFSIVDRAAKWGVIKRNTASRYKSRMTARLRLLESAAA